VYAAPFSYARARSLPEALAYLADAGEDAKLIAGGQSLVPLLRFRFARPALIVDIGPIDGLRHLEVSGTELHLGALLTESKLLASRMVGPAFAALTDAARVIADPLVRNRGTVGGNVAHADPANDLPAVMTALGAVAVVESTRGTREVPVAGMFLGPMATTLAADEIISGFRIRSAPGSGSAYIKIERQAGDYAIAGAAVWLRLDGGKVKEARIALTNAGPVAVECTAAETVVMDGAWESVQSEAASAAAMAGEFADDLRGSVAYKQAVARRAVRQALDVARTRAESVG
jgi:aerobic carbon-monoxide dehydrogenase medium subunit